MEIFRLRPRDMFGDFIMKFFVKDVGGDGTTKKF